jgi:predicted transcriptional regulator
MSLKSIWSGLEESYEELDEVVSPAIVKFANEMNLPSGWGTWAVAIALFPSEPISVAGYMNIFPYGLAEILEGRFASAAQGEYLISIEGEYRVTEKGEAITLQGLQSFTDAVAHLQPIPPAKFQGLIDYLAKLSDASFATSEPQSKFCLTHYRNYKRTFASDAPLPRLFIHYFKELDFYRMDSHMAAWRIYNIEGNRWEAFSEVWAGKNNTLDKVFEELSFRGITRDEYAHILQELVERGWIQEDAGMYRPTDEGKRIREGAEVLTDTYFFAAWSCLSESELEDLMNLTIQLRDGLKGGLK